MFKLRRTVRCSQCGFLAGTRMQQTSASPWEGVPVPVTARERSANDFAGKTCFRKLVNFDDEITPMLPVRGSPETENQETTRSLWTTRNTLRIGAVTRTRQCDWYERFRPALSFDGHLELQHRREEWRRTAFVALVAAIIGGLIATLPTIIFGHNVTVVIGR